MTSIFTDQYGAKFTGDIIKHGKVECEYPNGDKYVGEFKNDKMEGHGVYTYTNGEKYVGMWKDDKKHGRGTYTSISGNTSIGEWQDNQMNGHGSWQGGFPGDKYQGGFKNGLWDGHGRRDHQDGSYYVGNWKNGQMDGQGTITRTNGNTCSGIFNNGKEPVEGIYIEKDGPSYKFTRFSEIEDESSEEDIDELLIHSIEMDINGNKYNVVVSKQWVFSIDDEGDFTWEGMLNSDGDSVEECDPPDELMKFYEDDEVDEEGPWQFDVPAAHPLTDAKDATEGIAAKLSNGTIVVVSSDWYLGERASLARGRRAWGKIDDANYTTNMQGTLTDVTYPEEDDGFITGTYTPKA